MGCMTEKQLAELHEDIESGLVMIVEKKHYYELEAENNRLKKEKESDIKETKRLCGLVAQLCEEIEQASKGSE